MGENLAWELEALGRDAAIPAALFLADLPLVTKTAGRVRAAITTLTRFGPALHIYDHHRGWDTPEGRAIRQLCQTFIVKPRDTTAAAIIWADFLDRERKTAALAATDRSEGACDGSGGPEGLRSDRRASTAPALAASRTKSCTD